MDYIMPKEAAEKWGISMCHVQKSCEEGRIPGVIHFSRVGRYPRMQKNPQMAEYEKIKREVLHKNKILRKFSALQYTITLEGCVSMKILIIEDEKNLVNVLAHILKKSNYSVDVSFDGIDGQYQAETGVYDIIILDRMLPGKDGIKLLKSLRDEGIHTPVLMLTAKDSVQNRVEGLDAGADDYLIKPFSKDELMARLRALARRHSEVVFNDEIKVGKTIFSPYKGEIACGGQTVHLTVKESQLLEILIKNRDLVLSKEQILEKVWGYDSEVDLNNVEVYLSYLRRKLTKLDGGITIQTVRGIGYCLKEG